MQRINEIIDVVVGYYPQADIDAIVKAYRFSAKAHSDQVRKSGEPYLSHPLAVATLIAEMRLDITSICAALLHDTVEDTPATLTEIRKLLGVEVAFLVDGMTKIKFNSNLTKISCQARSLRKIVLAMARDIRVLLLKLADRLHNMRTLEFLSPMKQIAIARETLDIYAPMANRLGIHRWQTELEDLSLYYLDPVIYQHIQEAIHRRNQERKNFINEIKNVVQNTMSQNSIECKVDGRPKHYYSIYQKMDQRTIDIDNLYDLIAFRVVLKTLKECYNALGIIHNTWKPVPGRFRDYIGLPKTNMYQSLHTSVMGPRGQLIEMQIRTEEMHQIAEEGIAAHWQYKEYKVKEEPNDKYFAWLRQFIDWEVDLISPSEFVHLLRMDLNPKKIFIFTPIGEVKELPQGATPVDFAYAIHTEIGHQCVGAKVNGQVMPLEYQLSTGDQVEIITQPDHIPSKDWVKFVVTSRARIKISTYIRDVEKSQAIFLGRELLERELYKYSFSLDSIIYEDSLINLIVKEMCVKSFDHLLINIANGRITAQYFINYILNKFRHEFEKININKFFEEKSLSQQNYQGIIIKKSSDILIHFAKCCNPLPGDHIGGYISRGRGISIHLDKCPRLEQLESERRIKMIWDVALGELFSVKLQVESDSRFCLLTDLIASFKQQSINVLNASIRTTKDNRKVSIFYIQVYDINQLNQIILNLKRIKGVNSVKRFGIK